MTLAADHRSAASASAGPDSSDAAAGFGNPFDLDNEAGYRRWREWKLATYPRVAAEVRVEVADFAAPAPHEIAALVAACRRCNMAIYATPTLAVGPGESAGAVAGAQLRRFAAAFGLGLVEDHRSAGEDGVVAIEVTDKGGKRGFIPYTSKPLNWHTDGYYNAADDSIRAMVLHCVRPAREGGENALLDPEIAYIRLRDRSRAEIAAMLHPQAMTIPESVEEDGRVRPVSAGPVFIVGGDGRMTMRYTARARNVVWRDDADTRAAVAHLEALLGREEEPLILKYRLAAGEGLLCNNVLHTRTAFEDGEGAGRLMLRARYRERIAGT